MLNELSALTKNVAFPKLAWRGLFFCYLKYDPFKKQSVGFSNWHHLRLFLRDAWPTIYAASRFRLPWMDALNAHLNLLDEDPCGKYARSLLDGGSSVLDELKADLQIPEDGWFWPRLLLSQIDEAASCRDEEFRRLLEPLISGLQDHELIADDGLKRLLTRYHACTSHAANEPLKEFALDAWGNPQLLMQARWGLVDPAIKQMVQEWLVLEDLEDFFELLQADGAADTRRLNFWKCYLKQISFAHIALGTRAYKHPGEDYVALRRRKKGRVSVLKNATSTNNAFIMRIGQYYFVEFSETGNACYGYATDLMALDFAKGYFGLSDLKNRYKPKCVFWQTHQGQWERQFRWIMENMGITPESTRQTAAAPLPVQPLPPVQGTPGGDFNQATFLAFAQQHGLDVKDNRPMGGALWVHYFRGQGEVAQTLLDWGFKLNSKMGYWRGN